MADTISVFNVFSYEELRRKKYLLNEKEEIRCSRDVVVDGVNDNSIVTG